MDIHKIKAEIRKQIWEEMERKNIARFPRPVFGRIPNFIGAEIAAEKLRRLKEWEKAEVIFVNPDSPQKPVRANVLRDGKILIMASPRIKKGFILIDGKKVPSNKIEYAATIKGAFRFGRTIHPSEIMVDMKVTGCVAVDRKGGRLGKGHGYSDIEYGILREYGAINEKTPIVTTVHDIQIVNHIPMTQHDMPIDIIVTPTQVIYTNTKYNKPPGINWSEVTKEMLESIPLLKELAIKYERSMSKS